MRPSVGVGRPRPRSADDFDAADEAAAAAAAPLLPYNPRIEMRLYVCLAAQGFCPSGESGLGVAPKRPQIPSGRPLKNGEKLMGLLVF